MENKAEIWKAHPDIAGIEVSTQINQTLRILLNERES